MHDNLLGGRVLSFGIGIEGVLAQDRVGSCWLKS